MGGQSLWNPGDLRGSLPLELDDVHGCGDVGRITVGVGAAIKMVTEAKVTAWLSLVLSCAFVVSCFALGSTLMTTWGDAKHLHGWAARGRYDRVRAYVRTSTQYVGRCRQLSTRMLARNTGRRSRIALQPCCMRRRVPNARR